MNAATHREACALYRLELAEQGRLHIEAHPCICDALERRQPVMLDLFCKAGGCTRGYQLAGFYVVGLDYEPQPHYIGEAFVHSEALSALFDLLDGNPITDSTGCDWYLADFAAIHASPPCQDYSVTKTLHGNRHPALIGIVRDLLLATGKPYIIENVAGAPLAPYFQLCGSSFSLGVRRHRWFESNHILLTPDCRHDLQPEPIDVTGVGGPGGRHRKPRNLEHAQAVMGIDWMNRRELAQAIPPAYTHFIGKQLMEAL